MNLRLRSGGQPPPTGGFTVSFHRGAVQARTQSQRAGSWSEEKALPVSPPVSQSLRIAHRGEQHQAWRSAYLSQLSSLNWLKLYTGALFFKRIRASRALLSFNPALNECFV